MANKYMKRCSTSLVTRELKIKTIIRYHFTLTSMARIIKKSNNNKCAGEDIEKSEPNRVPLLVGL